MSETDYEALKRILAPILNLDETLSEHLLTSTFQDGTRLSFGCGPSGQLNMIVIQGAGLPQSGHRLKEPDEDEGEVE